MMFPKNPARLSIAVACAALLVALGISQFQRREDSIAPPHQSVQSGPVQVAHLAAHAEPTQTQTTDMKALESGPITKESAQSSAIPAFRQWAETAAAAGFANADETKGMELAKARATAMKALIQRDPASALREALPADLRVSLPPPIAAAIEQPVQTTGMVSIRMVCNHSTDTPHSGCESIPVLLENIVDWTAHYGVQQWRDYVGQEVRFDGVAVEAELAVRSITPRVKKEKP